MQNEHDDSVIICEKCNKSCKGGRKFKTHMNSHREVSCKHCGKKISYNSTSSHVTKCIGGGENSFKCDNCPAVFKTEGNLRVQVTNKSCPLKCNQCDKSEVTLVTFEEKTFLVSPKVFLKTKSEVTLVAFEEKTFLVSPQVSFKTKYLVTLVAFEEEKRFFLVLEFPSKVYL